MEKLASILVPEAVTLELAARDKVGAIKELADHLIRLGVITDPEAFYEAILRRENLESTGIGHGVAIPHARTRAVTTLALAFGRSAAGVDFSALDGQPSHLIFLIAAPEDRKTEYIVTLARLSRLLRRDEVRARLRDADDPRQVISVLAESDG